MIKIAQLQSLLIPLVALTLAVAATLSAYQFIAEPSYQRPPAPQLLPPGNADGELAGLFTVPAVTVPATAVSAAAPDYRLVAVVWSDLPWQSVAVLEQAGKRYRYHAGEALAGQPAARLATIEPQAVSLLLDGRLERLTLPERAPVGLPPVMRSAPPPAASLTTLFKLLPVYRNQDISHWQLLVHAPAYARNKWGIHNGDIILRVNEFNMQLPDQAFQAEKYWRNARVATLDISRSGKVITLEINLNH